MKGANFYVVHAISRFFQLLGLFDKLCVLFLHIFRLLFHRSYEILERVSAAFNLRFESVGFLPKFAQLFFVVLFLQTYEKPLFDDYSCLSFEDLCKSSNSFFMIDFISPTTDIMANIFSNIADVE